MSGPRWQRRVLHAEGPTRTAHDRTVEQNALSAAGTGLYGLALLRSGFTPPRVIATLSSYGRGIGPWEATCLDLETGEEFVVSSTDPDLEARRLRVTELPPHILHAWPRNADGRPVSPGEHVGPAQLRRIAAAATTADTQPAQQSLFA